ncbi:chemotaxis protein [Pseudoalteromonas sp. GCY]|uniref:methyl-accepting chemotaxis protein n=1 Tax=Pseudoalteromonas sp. GCY TaxID=2003316 RepID=UPI000BFEADB0|nr:methyl-accepting chemotaxis protein [Pseudoalteromonas sp. GCY]PHI38171.1 chemotaxis protein [Pseudoalteromonas sp. GCY]QQQ66227.1 methyl-accepting chemotaxis protein [Pseudoalteromonas sp. GCY]
MLNRVSVKSRLLSLSGIPAVFFILATIFTIGTLSNLTSYIDHIYDDRVVPLRKIKVVSDNYAVVIVDTFHKLRGNQLSNRAALNQIAEAKNIAEKEWSDYLSTDLTSEERNLIKQAESAELVVKELLSNYTSRVNANTFNEIPYDKFVRELYAAFDPLSESYSKLIELQLTEASRLRDRGRLEASTTKTVMIASSVVIVIVMVLIGMLIFRSINEPLSRLRMRIGNIARDADLTQRVVVEGQDELSQIGNDFNTMVSSLHQLVTNLVTIVNSLSTTSNELNGISQSIAGTSQEQEQQTVMIATAATEMSSAIQEVAHNAMNTANKAEMSGKLAKQGMDVISQNIQAIERLASEVGDNAQLIKALNDQSNEINQVVLMIQGVAEQTNLLALNAAIEAARAGESGRGFAVVADEVRQLAHNTQKATESIRDMISKLQGMAQNAVSSMENAQSSAAAGVDRANESAQIMTDIDKAVDEIVGMNIQVSTATEEQTTVVAEISENINDFSSSISEITRNAQSNADVSNDLEALAEQLNSQVLVFKV